VGESIVVAAWVVERNFCSGVAQTNKLELLKWVREVKKCDWDERTIRVAAEQGMLEIVKYCVENQCPVNDEACTMTALHGHFVVLKYLHEKAEAPWDGRAVREARWRNRPECLQYLLDNNCPFLEMKRFECSRCGYKTHHKHHMEQHIGRKFPCELRNANQPR
jgi:hypothetical protein